MMGKIKITNLDDHLLPNIACTKPVENPAALTLSDCLACAGCITTAETVLLSSQSHEKLKENIHDCVLSIAPQTLASLEQKFGLQTIKSLFALLRAKGIQAVCSLNIAIDIALLLSLQEFRDRKASQNLPVMSGECPAWTCFAEKHQTDFLIPLMSTLKSPMQIQGLLVKQIYGDKTFHCSLQPCYDKKIESFRSDGVDLVLSSQEFIEALIILDILNKDLTLKQDVQSNERIFDVSFEHQLKEFFKIDHNNDQQNQEEDLCQIQSLTDVTSNTYLETIMHVLLQEEKLTLSYKQGKNQDIMVILIKQEYRLMAGEEVKYFFAKIYGFKNIQNLVRNIKKKNPYHYIEIMACPGGCLNGGGQLKSKEFKPRELAQLLFQRMIENKKLQIPQTNLLADRIATHGKLDFSMKYSHIKPDEQHIRW